MDPDGSNSCRQSMMETVHRLTMDMLHLRRSGTWF